MAVPVRVKPPVFGEHHFCACPHRCQPSIQERSVLMAMNNTYIPCSDKVAQLPYEFPVKSGGTGDPVHGNTFLPHLLPDCPNLPIDTDYFVFDLQSEEHTSELQSRP